MGRAGCHQHAGGSGPGVRPAGSSRLGKRPRGIRANVLYGTTFDPIRVLPTLGIDTPEAMAQRASTHTGAAWLKVKLGCSDGRDAERLEAVAGALPGVPLLVDVNGGWTPQVLARMLPLAQRLGVRMIEQPMDPSLDHELPHPPRDLLVCADESCMDRTSLELVGRTAKRVAERSSCRFPIGCSSEVKEDGGSYANQLSSGIHG